MECKLFNAIMGSLEDFRLKEVDLLLVSHLTVKTTESATALGTHQVH